jgi:short-subunit dehydrogenase
MKELHMSPTAIILGVCQEKGLDSARTWAKAGMDLILVDQSEELLLLLRDTLQQQFHVQVRIIAEDMAQPDAATHILDACMMYQLCSEKAFSIELIAYHVSPEAFHLQKGDIWETEQTAFHRHMTNFADLVHNLSAAMARKRKGRIISLLDSPRSQGLNGLYDAGRYYLREFSRSIAEQYQGSGLHIDVKA